MTWNIPLRVSFCIDLNVEGLDIKHMVLRRLGVEPLGVGTTALNSFAGSG
jgi:hypothetical protein